MRTSHKTGCPKLAKPGWAFLRGSKLPLLLFILPAPCLAASPHYVFAHYMLANQDYVAADAPPAAVIASYQREIQQAQAIGIDGFALNAGGWSKEPRYILRASEMFEAALQLHTNFKLFFSADMCCSNSAEDVEDMMRRFAGDPRYASVYYQQDGRFLLTTFAGETKGPLFWLNLRLDLAKGTHPSTHDAPNALPFVSGVPSNKPIAVSLITAFFWGGETPTRPDIDAGLAQFGPILAGSFYWGIAAVPGLAKGPNQIPSTDAYAAALHQAGKFYLAPIAFQFWGANAKRFYDYSGFSGMRALWMDAINVSHPDAIEIITWNDFIEGTYVSPIDDPAAYPGANDLGASVAPPTTRHLFHTHAGATALLAYFIQWYKTGTQPTLSNDAIYWAYRTVTAKPARTIKLYGPATNTIYLTANLTAAATLKVTQGDDVKIIQLPAGSTDVQVPIPTGPTQTPVFDLTGGTTLLAHATGADPITPGAPYPNLYYSTGSAHD